MEAKMESIQNYVESPTFREYLLWKNQNINVNSLLLRLSSAHSPNHALGILKSVLYDSQRFQFQDYSLQFIDLMFSDERLLNLSEILVYQPIAKLAEFDILMSEKRIFELKNVIESFGKTVKITHDETEFAVNPCSWIQKNKGINSDFLDICFRGKADTKVLKFIHYLETYCFMATLFNFEKDPESKRSQESQKKSKE